MPHITVGICAAQALGSLPWFAGGAAAASLADGAVKGGSAYTPAELHTALQAAHMLAWEHERAHGAPIWDVLLKGRLCMESRRSCIARVLSRSQGKPRWKRQGA